MSLATSRIYAYTTTGNKSPLIMPDGYLRFNVRLVCNSSTAKIQHTLYPKSVVEADPALAQWVDWPFGTITTSKEARIAGAPTAFRVVVESGADVKLEVNVTER